MGSLEEWPRDRCATDATPGVKQAFAEAISGPNSFFAEGRAGGGGAQAQISTKTHDDGKIRAKFMQNFARFSCQNSCVFRAPERGRAAKEFLGRAVVAGGRAAGLGQTFPERDHYFSYFCRADRFDLLEPPLVVVSRAGRPM